MKELIEKYGETLRISWRAQGKGKVMGNNILSDLKTVAGLFKQIRQARKEGAEIRVRKQMQLSVIDTDPDPSLIHTVEGSVLVSCSQTIYGAAMESFMRLSYEERHRLSFSPNDGEFIERANLWKEILKPVMTPVQYHTAIKKILHWYIHIKLST